MPEALLAQVPALRMMDSAIGPPFGQSVSAVARLRAAAAFYGAHAVAPADRRGAAPAG
jgi:hypothetical protein